MASLSIELGNSKCKTIKEFTETYGVSKTWVRKRIAKNPNITLEQLEEDVVLYKSRFNCFLGNFSTLEEFCAYLHTTAHVYNTALKNQPSMTANEFIELLARQAVLVEKTGKKKRYGLNHSSTEIICSKGRFPSWRSLCDALGAGNSYINTLQNKVPRIKEKPELIVKSIEGINVTIDDVTFTTIAELEEYLGVPKYYSFNWLIENDSEDYYEFAEFVRTTDKVISTSGEYNSIEEFAEAIGVPAEAVHRLRSQEPKAAYKDIEWAEKLNTRHIQCSEGWFMGVGDLANHLGVGRSHLSVLIKNNPGVGIDDIIDKVKTHKCKTITKYGNFDSTVEASTVLFGNSNALSNFKYAHPELANATLEELITAKYESIKNKGYHTKIGTFNSLASLSSALGKNDTYISYMRKEHPDWSLYDIIDYALDGKIYTSAGVFNNTTNLALWLGMEESDVVSWIRNNPKSSADELLIQVVGDSKLNLKTSIGTFYSKGGLARALNTTVHRLDKILNAHKDYSIEDAIYHVQNGLFLFDDVNGLKSREQGKATGKLGLNGDEDTSADGIAISTVTVTPDELLDDTDIGLAVTSRQPSIKVFINPVFTATGKVLRGGYADDIIGEKRRNHDTYRQALAESAVTAEPNLTPEVAQLEAANNTSPTRKANKRRLRTRALIGAELGINMREMAAIETATNMKPMQVYEFVLQKREEDGDWDISHEYKNIQLRGESYRGIVQLCDCTGINKDKFKRIYADRLDLTVEDIVKMLE